MTNHKRILVVDDEADMRSMLNLLLSATGYDVALAESGFLAIEYCRKRSPDLILLDIQMPQMDGLETLKRLREDDDVPVIMLTVRGQPEERTRGLVAGADDYVPKPFNREELLARIQAVLRRTPQRRSNKIRVGWLDIDLNRDRALIKGEPIDLSFQSWRLLRALAAHLGEHVTAQELIEAVWQGEKITSHHRKRLKVEVLKLRRKVRDTHPPQLIHAQYRKGYTLDYRPHAK